MGRLQRLELENFKSYAGKHVVGPFDNLTCIVGPNGSGKSNMMDAISFVLGVQSKHLRSSHLKELIFKRDTSSAPERRASVKLVYVLSDGEVEGMEGESELSFARTISVSGVSTYRLNDRDSTYELYEEMLQKIGVLIKARNFLVFQGDVESVASKSPVELTKLLEQISGSEQYSTEYSELMQKKEETEESTIFMMQKKKLYSVQCKEVKAQKDEAESYQKKKEQCNNLKSDHVLWQVWRIKSTIEEHQQQADEMREEIESIKNRESDLDASIQDEKKELARCNKNTTAAEKELVGKTKQLESISPTLAETVAKLKSLRKRLTEVKVSESKIQKDHADQETNMATLSSEILELEALEQQLIEQLESGDAGELKMDAAKVAEYSRLREEVSARTATYKAEEVSLLLELKSKRQRVERIGSQVQILQQDLETGDRLIGEYASRVTKLRGAIDEGQKEKDQLRRDREQAAREMQQCKEREEQYTAELEEVSGKLRDVGDDRRRSKQEERMNEAIENMKRIFTGVHGKLVDLCRPIQKKYSQAIAVAAGTQMDAIVVESKQVAADCIRYLKDQRVGICTLLPLNGISPKPVPDRYRSFGAKYKLCLDLVECEEAFKPAVLYALGATIACETLEDAQELCFQRGERVKVVTYRGHSIGRSGAMTGGAPPREGQDRWEEKDIDRLRKRKAELDSLLAKNKQDAPTRQMLIDIETKYKTLQTRIQFSEADVKVAEEKMTQKQQQKKLSEDNIRELLNESAKLTTEIAAAESRQQILQDSIRTVEAEVFGAFSKSVGVTNIREYEDSKLKFHNELVQRRQTTAERRAALTAQLEYERKRDFAGALQRIGTQLTDIAAEIKRFENEEANLLEKERTLKEDITKINDRLDVAKEEKTTISNRFKTLQANRMVLVGEREAVVKKLSGSDILIEKARSQLHEVLQKAQVDEIALPVVPVNDDDEEGSDKDLLWTGSQSQSQSQRRASSRSREESSGASQAVSDQAIANKIDLSSMEKFSGQNKQSLAEHESNLLKQIAVLTGELENMQPNMHASERYDVLLEKLRDCNQELESAKEVARSASTRFEEVKRLRQQLFQNCYRHVSESLGVIYKDLTKSSKHPLGGNAYLTLDNTDEPYLGGIRFTAMPPMKRFRDMDQLSGGEKTIAALALLFSIHSYRPAPFFVLDEVDAALDNVNIRKVCNYIKQRSQDFQCVVISLKELFFENADSLVGICKDVSTVSSRILTLDLKKYERVPRQSGPMGPAQSIKTYAPSPVSTDRSHVGTPSTAGGLTPSGRTPGSAGSLGKRRVSPSEDLYRQQQASRQQQSLLSEAIVEEGEDDE